MGEKVIAFLSGAAKAYDLFGSLDSHKKKPITIQSGFENVGEAFKKVISEDVKTDTKKQNKQAVS
ncbi:hypothetical protein [Campylobacter majalis]|uniref:hypothetical protein n=1 Tax=Campylobacter majalis TaxID=2790656 RepID=UPI003D69E09E